MAADGDSKPKTDSFAALRYKDFRSYLAMRFFFTIAYQMQTTVLGFYIYQRTGSKMAIAYIGLSEAVPALLIAMYGGYIADKYEKRKMLLLIYTGVFLSSLTIFIVTLKSMAAYTDGWIPLIIYAMIFCNGVARAFYGPATFIVYSHSIPREIYPNAATWSSSSWQVASILGPLIAGFTYAFGNRIVAGISGITATYSVIIFFLLVSLVVVYTLRKYPPSFVEKAESKWESLLAGLHFVFENKIMFYAMSLDLFSVFFGGVVALLPVFALDILKVGPEGLGIMRMASSLGAVITMIIMVRFSPMNKPWRNLLIVITGFGLSIIGFGLSKTFYLALFFLFAQGAFDSVSVIIRSTLMQLLVPDDMRGRVSAVSSMFIGSSNELGDFESGVAAKLFNTIPAVLFGGTMTLSIVTFTYFKTKKLIPLSLSEIQTPEAAAAE